MAKILRDRYFWYIVALVVLPGIILYTTEDTFIGWLPSGGEWHETFMLFYYSLFLLSVAIAAWKFGIKGGLATCLAIGLILLPHAVTDMLNPFQPDWLVQLLITSTIAVMLSWLIGSHKRAGEALQESEERFRNLFEDTHDMVQSVAPDGHFIFVNRAWLETLGYNEAELQGLHLFKIIHPESLSHCQEVISRIKAEESVSSCQVTFVAKDGRSILAEGNMTGRFIDGKFVGTQGIFRDITERKQAEEKIKQAAKEWRNTFDSITDLVSIHDRDFRITRVNMAFADTFKMHPKELIGKKCYEVVHGTNEPWPDCPQAQTLKTKKPTVLEMFEPSLGVHLHLSTSPVFNEKGEVTGTVHIARDITEHKKLEAQFLQSQKMEAIGVLAGGVAHDFNNLLTVILGYSELVLDGLGDNEPLRKDIEEIKNAGERASSLTRQLLTFSRQEVLQPEILNLNALATNIEKMLRRLIGEDIELLTVLEPKVKSIKADPGQIEQVIMNLVVNARDAMPGGGKITIKTENITVEEEYCKFYPDAKAGEFVCLTVEDTGTGIDKGTLQHIFEPFFTTKGLSKGTGLGLSVVYGIAKQHGGWINVYSEPGQGATFRIYLPVVSAEATEQTEEAVSIDQLKGNGERILVVEDEGVIREFVTRALGENGYVLFEAADVREALDIFEKEQGRFDLVFSDVVLPDKNGLELAVQLLSLKPQLPILMTSGYTDQKANWPLIQEQGFRFLQKPYTIIGLLQAVKEAIEKSESSPASAAANLNH